MDKTPEPPVPPGRTDVRDLPEDAEGRSPWVWVFAVGAAAALGFGAYYWQTRSPVPPAPPPEPLPRVEAPKPGPLDEQAVVEHPLPAPAAEPPLPALAASDALVVPALIELAGNPRLQELLQLPGVIRRIVVTVDNLPRNKLPPENWPLRPVAGAFRVRGSAAAGTLAIDAANASRYATHVKLFESIDVKQLVALYVRTYPLFQEAYVELGYPKRYFNDRLLQVIEHLLAAPQPAGPLKLVQPKLAYEFEDETLQSLSVGHKAMLRIGPDNAARVKARLVELRDEILRNSEKR